MRTGIARFQILWMFFIFLIQFFILALPAAVFGGESANVLLINSNAEVEKYSRVQRAFRESMAHPIMEVDLGIGEMEEKMLQAYGPDMIYCIGTKAYTLAAKSFDSRPIVFTSIINWLRLPLSETTYGVSNELPTRMPIMMYRYIFPEIRAIGMLYSPYYTRELYESAFKEAAELGIQIIGEEVSGKEQSRKKLSALLPKIDAFWLIADPLVIPDKKSLYGIIEKCDEKKIPVFSYHDIFAEIGASLIVSADLPTIGRQAAAIASELLAGGRPQERVQYPAGSHITLNLKKVKAYNIPYNKDALNAINDIIQ